MITKVCKKCEKEKEKKEFYKNKAVCKICISENSKEKCKYCLKIFNNLAKHEKTKHSDEEEFKYVNNLITYTCNDCENNFLLNEFNHYNDKCKKCYNISRKKRKVKCGVCDKMFNFYYFKIHKCRPIEPEV